MDNSKKLDIDSNRMIFRIGSGNDQLLQKFRKEIEKHGFKQANLPEIRQNPQIRQEGWIYAFKNSILAGPIRDCSFLAFTPQFLFRPRTITQLKRIVVTAKQFSIPISFAGGKTGLSGGFANPFILIDMENLQTIDPPIQLYFDQEIIHVDQNIEVGHLIRSIPFKTNNRLIFPTQPSSSYKLPVRVGGLIATNASGVTSGKLGPIKDWIIDLTVMDPHGNVRIVSPEDSLFHQVIGGMGIFGIILHAKIRLATQPQNNGYRILYGHHLAETMEGLQEIQDQAIFPLVSEFILSSDAIPGKFATLFQNKPVKWAILLKGDQMLLKKFTSVLEQHTDVICQELDSTEYQDFLEERSALAIQAGGGSLGKEFVRFPGFEDILMPPKQAIEIFNRINRKLKKYQFPPSVVGYGHLNFRKGQGMLLHIRLPVAVDALSQPSPNLYRQIAQVISEVNVWLTKHYIIRPKAEHGPGILFPWLHRNELSQYLQKIQTHDIFYHPVFYIYMVIINQLKEQTKDSNTIDQDLEKTALTSLFFYYLSGRCPN